jgi:hypothetical protein
LRAGRSTSNGTGARTSSHGSARAQRRRVDRKDAIVPDLIVHRVGKRENRLVAEVKKASNKDFDGDIWNLRGMTEQAGPYGYTVGRHLVIDVKAGTAPRSDVYVGADCG